MDSNISKSISKRPWLDSWLITAVIWLITVPTWAISPQSGDAAEQLMTALQGGVIHPPGFPLQSWLNRLFVLLPFGTPSYRISFLDSLGYACLAFALLEIQRLLGCDRASRIAGTAAAVFFPILWYLGVHPEVFSLANAAAALLLLQAVSLGTGKIEAGGWAAFFLGGGVALAWSQHTVTVFAFPACLASAYHILRVPKTRARHLAILGVSFLIPFCSLYASLILMGRNAVWPNWGPPRNLIEVINHLLRKDYGSFTLAMHLEGNNTPPTFGILVLFSELWENWQVTLGLVFFGIFSLVGRDKKQPRSVSYAVLGNLLASLIFLCLAKAHFGPASSRAHLERFFGLALIPLAVLFGLGADSLRRWLPEGFRKGALAIFVAVLFISSWEFADGSARMLTDLYREALALDLPNNAAYVAFSDLECDYGVPTENGIRFPVQAGDIGSDWYKQRVVAAVEPRFAGLGPFETMPDLIQLAHDKKIPIASGDPFLLAHVNQTPELRGLLFFDAGSQAMYTEQTVRSAIRLCPLISQFVALPAEPTQFDRYIYDPFARAFQGASTYLETSGDLFHARVMQDISNSLKFGQYPETWRKLCEKLK